MSAASLSPRRHLQLLWLLGAAVLLGLALASGELRNLLAEALSQVTPLAVLATMPGHIAATLLCAAALHALRPGVSYLASLAARLLRDAGDNLLFFLPGFGEVIGARALVLAGGQARAAVSASALDKFAETAAQLPYIALAAWVLWHSWNAPSPLSGSAVGVALAASAAGLWVLYAGWRRFGAKSRYGIRLLEEWRKLADEARQQKSGLPLSILLHFFAWVLGGLQIWMAAQALGFELTLFEAVALESAAYAGRAIFFFIPAGLVTQEAGLVAAGLVFGLSPAESLTLGLVLRLRDVLTGAALLLWPLMEWRSRTRSFSER